MVAFNDKMTNQLSWYALIGISVVIPDTPKFYEVSVS